MTFTVITRVPDPEKGEDGNLALALPIYFELNGKVQALSPLTALPLRMPVFALGEILILDDYGREYGGLGRKPSKWAVETEEFADLPAAIARAQAVTA